MTGDFPVLAGDRLIDWLVAAGTRARAEAATDHLPVVTLGLAEAAEVQGRVIGMVEGRNGTDWLVLLDGAEAHHVRLQDISRVSVALEAMRRLSAAADAGSAPGRLGLARRGAAIAAAVQAELAAPFSIDLDFDGFAEDEATERAIDANLSALAEALRRQTAAPLGIDRLSVHIKGILIAASGGEPAGIARKGERLVLRLSHSDEGVEVFPADELARELQAVLS
ncbi:hypothetical protein L2U69_12085 [Zavarzinia compransoris]|uniref:hypothetical protein n=1 Tax=Zavarzinia marina TaxID=2911065 RepID=UPI001F2F15F6|nr:hypothetical protein [Zavarzinia marina]MCF4166385.1 hypothetical protein [Zavarzinia marina]